MKTGIEMVQDGYQLLNVDAVLSLISGKIYLFERPQNSDKQDIVLNTLALTNDQLQQGVFNVNYHCPNIKGLVIAGETDNTQPDIVSMLQVVKVILSILNQYQGFDYRLSAQTSGLPIKDNGDGSWYINTRVNYSAFQQNYSNI